MVFHHTGHISPVAHISIPAKGGTCIVGQAYEFSGNGNDSEEGLLSGASFWSATTLAMDAEWAWFVGFVTGNVIESYKYGHDNGGWSGVCVRGGI